MKTLSLWRPERSTFDDNRSYVALPSTPENAARTTPIEFAALRSKEPYRRFKNGWMMRMLRRAVQLTSKIDFPHPH